MKEQNTIDVTDTWVQLPIGTIHVSNTGKSGAIYHKLSSTEPTSVEGLRPLFKYEDVIFSVDDTCWVINLSSTPGAIEKILYTIEA